MKWLYLTWAMLAAIPLRHRCRSKSATFMRCDLKLWHLAPHQHTTEKGSTWYWTQERVARCEIP